MIDFEIETPSAARISAMYRGFDKQARYAFMQTLNEIAFGVRKAVFVPAVERAFSLTNRFLVKGLRPGARGPGGIGVDKATKQYLDARIFFGEGAEFLSLHEDSGWKLPPGGESKFLIKTKAAGRTKRADLLRMARSGSKVRGRRLAKGVKRNKAQRTFIAGEGTSRERIMRRPAGKEDGKRFTGSGKRRRPRRRLRRVAFTLAWFEPRARIRKVLDVHDESHAYISKHYRETFARWLEHADRTARK